MQSAWKYMVAFAAGFILVVGCISIFHSIVQSTAKTEAAIEKQALISLENLVSRDPKKEESLIYAVRESRILESQSIAESIREESESRIAASIARAMSVVASRREEAGSFAWEEHDRVLAERVAEESRAEESRQAELESIQASREAESRAAAEAASRAAAEAASRAAAEASSRAAAQTSAAQPTAAPPVAGGQVVFIGDSRTSGFIGSGLMPASRCFVFGGAVYAWYDNVRAAAALQPSKVVFFGGQNDLGVYKGNEKAFIAEYKKLISSFLSLSPGSTIYCNLILPCTEVAVREQPGREKRAEYNAAIQQMCAENGWYCIDTSGGFNASYFTGDGIHFNFNWYPIWWQNLRAQVGF